MNSLCYVKTLIFQSVSESELPLAFSFEKQRLSTKILKKQFPHQVNNTFSSKQNIWIIKVQLAKHLFFFSFLSNGGQKSNFH